MREAISGNRWQSEALLEQLEVAHLWMREAISGNQWQSEALLERREAICGMRTSRSVS